MPARPFCMKCYLNDVPTTMHVIFFKLHVFWMILMP